LSNNVIVIGGGPAGIACAYTLAHREKRSTVIEKEDTVGGLCRTINFNGYLFDIGGHRFLSSSKEINQLWKDIMGDNMLHVKRLSRIYYRKRFFNYPLSFLNTFRNLGLVESFLCIVSYLRCVLFRPGNDATFEGWIINRFGKRLYDIFFKTYTEKVWAVACQNISADWAKERILGLSLRVAIKKALLGTKRNMPKTLSEEFLYPRTGPGEFYEKLKQLSEKSGAEILCKRSASRIRYDQNKIVSLEVENSIKGQAETLPVDYLFASMPLPYLVKTLEPRPPEAIIAAASRLKFRSILIVNLILNKEFIFPDQWLYVHSPEVRLGRIQNYKNWSPAMVQDPEKTSLGLEYFCTEDDSFWRMSDVDLINLALEELEKLGIASRKHLINGFVVRRPDAYPVYSLNYHKDVNTIKKFLSQFSNLSCIGRGGLFRYDNSDRALLSGIHAAKGYLEKIGYEKEPRKHETDKK